MKQLGSILVIGALIFLTQATSSHAQTNCTQIFGGGSTCQTSDKIGVTKQVKNPQSNTFVSSLPNTGPFYTADQAITFRLTVENKTNNRLNKITLTDTLPKYFIYSMGEGKFDKAKNTLTISLDRLNGKEKKTYDITGKIASAND